MGYLGFFYVETKAFEIRSEFCVGGGVQLAERSRGLFRAVFLGIVSINWFRKSMEALQQGWDA
jgi:hypothetical protein